MSKRLTNPKDLRFVVLRQHMTILSLKERAQEREKHIKRLKSRIEKLKGNTWFRRMLRRIKNFFKRNNA